MDSGSQNPARITSIRTAIDLLVVVALGLSAGAMLAEGAVLVPYWRSLPAREFLSWYAVNASRLLEFFGPLEIAAAVFAIVAAVLHYYERRAGRHFLLASTVLALAVLAAFPLYFLDLNASFAAGSIDVDRVAPELARWGWWHGARTAIGVIAFATAVLGIRGKS
jgi:hypothetical protein